MSSSSSSNSNNGEEVMYMRQTKGSSFKFLVPLIYAPVLPLIRLTLRHKPVLRDRLFTAVLVGAFAHGSYLVISVVYMLTIPIPEDGGDDATVEQIRKRNKWDNDDYAKYMAEDVSSKKFLVSNFTNYKMTDSRPVMEQYNELLGILGRFTQHKMNMDKAIHVSCIIDKLPHSWKDFKHTLKHKKEELTLLSWAVIYALRSPSSYLCDLNAILSLGNKKYFVTFIDDASRTDRGGLSQGFWGEAMLTDCYLLNRVPNKRNTITPYELWTKRKPNLNYLRVWCCRAVVRLPDPKLKTLGERGIVLGK
ncbi:hypothetical protein Tco_0630811 [Tanacetum coccineum]